MFMRGASSLGFVVDLRRVFGAKAIRKFAVVHEGEAN